MYLGGGKVGEFKGWPGGYSQATINARWAEIGQPPPPPILPPDLIGMEPVATRGPRMFRPVGGGKKSTTNISKFKDPKGVNNFLNFWGKVAVDPYRKQSGISKIAGGILQVASAVVPVFGYMNAAVTAGNMGLQANAAKDFEKTAAQVMAPAYALQEAQEKQAVENAAAAQVAALQALRPTLNAAPVGSAPVPTGDDAATWVPGWTNEELTVAALLGGVFLLGVMRR